MTSPSVFEYDDYRRFLADWVEAARQKRGFSLRGFARAAGFRAHNVLQLVIGGKRNLSAKSVRKFASGLRLNEAQTDYFERLVAMNQAGDSAEMLMRYRKLVAHPGRRRAAPLEKARLGFFEEWLAPVIYELVRFPGFKPDAAWIAEQLGGEATVNDIKRVWRGLVEGRFVYESGGVWRQAQDFVATGDGVHDVRLFGYHETSLAKAADALRLIPSTRRRFQVLTAAVPASLWPRLVELAEEYERKVWAEIDAASEPCDEIVHIGVQTFKVLPERGRNLKKRG